MDTLRCETNDKEKTAAIEEAESRITALTSAIEEGTATSSRLNTEIKNLEAEIAKNQEALDKATAMRQVSRWCEGKEESIAFCVL